MRKFPSVRGVLDALRWFVGPLPVQVTVVHVVKVVGLDDDEIATAVRRQLARRGLRQAKPTRRSGSGRVVSEAEAREIEREIA